MSIKDRLFRVMEEIAKLYGTQSITTIICCETTDVIDSPMVGYRNSKGRGTALIITAVPEAIQQILDKALELKNSSTGGNGSDSEQ